MKVTLGREPGGRHIKRTLTIAVVATVLATGTLVTAHFIEDGLERHAQAVPVTARVTCDIAEQTARHYMEAHAPASVAAPLTDSGNVGEDVVVGVRSCDSDGHAGESTTAAYWRVEFSRPSNGADVWLLVDGYAPRVLACQGAPVPVIGQR